MPYKFETLKLKVGRKNDRRRKLTAKQKKRVRELYGLLSQRELAKKFKVSRRLIIFIGCPEKYEHHKILAKERRKDGRYYHKEKHTIQIKRHRQHKKEIFGITCIKHKPYKANKPL